MSQYTSKKHVENRSGGGASSWIYMPIFGAHTREEYEEDPSGEIDYVVIYL